MFCLHSCFLTFFARFQKISAVLSFSKLILPVQGFAVLSWRVTSSLASLDSRHRSSLCVLLACCRNLYRLFMHINAHKVTCGNSGYQIKSILMWTKRRTPNVWRSSVIKFQCFWIRQCVINLGCFLFLLGSAGKWIRWLANHRARKIVYFLSYYNTTISQIQLYKTKVTSCWYSNNCLKH